MMIRETLRDHDVAVVALYWSEYSGKMQKHFLVVPYSGYEGLVSVPECECQITESSLDGFCLLESASGEDLVCLGFVADNDLLDRMIDHDPEAMNEFYELLAKAG